MTRAWPDENQNVMCDSLDDAGANAWREPASPSHCGVWSLVGSATVIAFIWLVVLPWTAKRPAMKSHIQWLDRKGIDPSAMYYTDLEVMESILQRQADATSRER